MKRMRLFEKMRTAAGLMLIGISAHAQTARIDITKDVVPGATPPIWLSLSGFNPEASQVLKFDLYVQGFNFTNAANAQYLISGNNNANVQAHVMDRYQKQELWSKAYSGASLRRQTHAFVDDFVEMLGRKGIAKTKIAFKVDSGVGRDMHSEIFVSDFDGHNAQAVTQDNNSLTQAENTLNQENLSIAAKRYVSPMGAP